MLLYDCLCSSLTFLITPETKVDIKIEDDSESRDKDVQQEEQQPGQDGTGQAEQVKVEADKSGQHSRKRPYEESRGYGYYEHREDKRYADHKVLVCIVTDATDPVEHHHNVSSFLLC